MLRIVIIRFAAKTELANEMC